MLVDIYTLFDQLPSFFSVCVLLLSLVKHFYRTMNIIKLQRTYRKMIRNRKIKYTFVRNMSARVITKFFRSLKKITKRQQQAAVQKLFESTWHIRLIQNYIRRFKARRKYTVLRNSVVCIQCTWRCYKARVVVGDLFEIQWHENRARRAHMKIIEKLRYTTEELDRLFTFQLMKDEWAAGNVLVHAVRHYWWKCERIKSKDIIMRGWFCYRAKCLAASLRLWHKRYIHAYVGLFRNSRTELFVPLVRFFVLILVTFFRFVCSTQIPSKFGSTLDRQWVASDVYRSPRWS